MARVRRELIRSPSQKGGRRRVYRPWTRFEHSNGMCQAPETAFCFLQVCCGKGNSPSLMSDCPIRNVRVGSCTSDFTEGSRPISSAAIPRADILRSAGLCQQRTSSEGTQVPIGNLNDG